MAEGLRAGIAGAGFIGEVHARAVRVVGATVTAVAASSQERSAAAAQRLQAGRAARSGLSVCVDGEAGSLAFSQHSPEALCAGERGENRVLPQSYQECFNAFLRDSYAALTGRKPDGLPDFVDGLRAAVLTEAVMQAAAKEDGVEVPREGGLDA